MDLDPRWEWSEVRRLCDTEPIYIKGRCLHTETVEVASPEHLGGAIHGRLCLTCDRLLMAVSV